MTRVPRFFQDPGGSFFLFGPRGTGKSTWLREHLKADVWLDLLDPEMVQRLTARPGRLREIMAGHRGATTVVIDEVQKVPELLSLVHPACPGLRATE